MASDDEKPGWAAQAEKDMERHLEKIAQMRCFIDVPASAILAAVSLLQVGLRHPGVEEFGSTVDRAREIKDIFIDALDMMSPGFGFYLRLGDDPDLDIPPVERKRKH